MDFLNLSLGELATLWRYALSFERLLMSLGLNCGFGMAELACDRLHRIGFEPIGVEHHRERIAGEALVGEHVERCKRQFHRCHICYTVTLVRHAYAWLWALPSSTRGGWPPPATVRYFDRMCMNAWRRHSATSLPSWL